MLNEIVEKYDLNNRIIETIQSRLKNRGTTANGKQLKTDQSFFEGGRNVYAKFTIREKTFKGQEYSVVTLNDSGSFFRTFKTTFFRDRIEVEADFNKGDERISENFRLTFTDERFVSEILSLTKKEKKELGIFIVNELVKIILETIKK